MAWKFYYDKYMEDPCHTFRIVGQKMATSSDGTVAARNTVSGISYKLTDDAVILRDIIRDNIRVDIQHSYSYSSPSLTEITANWDAWLANARVRIDSMSTEIRQALEQFRDNPEVILNPNKNAHVYTPSDFYKNFEGTSITIPLQFSVRLFRKRVNGTFTSPVDQLKTVNDYFLGAYYNGDDKKYRIYMAPHGYAGATQQGWNIKGTLSLFYGQMAVFDNLLLTNYNFQLSREMDEEGGPLYVDLSFGLMPAVIFTQDDINKITGIAGTNGDSSEYQSRTGWQ